MAKFQHPDERPEAQQSGRDAAPNARRQADPPDALLRALKDAPNMQVPPALAERITQRLRTERAARPLSLIWLIVGALLALIAGAVWVGRGLTPAWSRLEQVAGALPWRLLLAAGLCLLLSALLRQWLRARDRR